MNADSGSGSAERPAYYKPCRPHNCRRANFHDYKAHFSYLITVSKSTEAPSFSSIIGGLLDPADPPRCKLTTAGSIIQCQIEALPVDFPLLCIPAYVIMLDHIHLLVQVRSRLDRDLGYYIGLFKTRCTKNYHEAKIGSGALFMPKFNDRIAFSRPHFQRFVDYVADNPRRRLMAMSHPELFESQRGVMIGDREFSFYGNFLLLREPDIVPVVVSSRYTSEERARWELRWEQTMRNQGVLISPFISAAEKAIMREGIEAGCSLIRIIPDGMAPRAKAQGLEFELCSERRLLLIGESRQSKRNEALSRDRALGCNSLAFWIAENTGSVMKLLRK